MRSTLVHSGILLSAVLAGATSAWAAEGVQLSQRTTIGTTQQTSQIQIEKNRVRAEMTGGASGRMAVIFDAGKQIVQILNLDRKTYSELTKAQIDQLGGAMQDMMSQMQSAMANMPPAQRAQMEAAMRGRGMGVAPPKTEYKKTGADHVGKWACDKYEGSANGQKVSELCTVDPSVLGLTAADVQTFRQLAEFFRKLVPQSAAMPNLSDPGFSGVPIKSVSTSGSTQITTEMTDASRQTFADSQFTVPSDFTKEEFPMMGGAGRRGR
jgi:uncharacterized protein DUF4412